MQDSLEVRLGFDSADFLGADMPTGLDARIIIDALKSSLEEVIGNSQFSTARNLGLRVVALSGQKLLAAKRPKESIYLLEGAIAKYRTRPALATVRLKALRSLGQVTQTIESADQLLADPAIDLDTAKKYASLLRRFDYHHAAAASFSRFAYFYGDIDRFIEDPVGEIDKLVAKSAYETDAPAARLMALRNLSRPGERRDFLFQLHWGREIFALAKFVGAIRLKIIAIDLAERYSAENKKVLALWEKIQSMISPQGVENIRVALAPCGRNRSVVFAHAHSGMSVVLGLPMPEKSLAVSVVSNGATNVSAGTNFHLKTGAESTVRDFAKLVKLSKKEPRIVRIFPDGQQGELYSAVLMGKRFTMGRGAATLAFLSGAATFFGAYSWRDRKFVFELQPGPDPVEFKDKEQFESAFCDFYTGCLERILMGPPENIALAATFWRIHAN